jgi:hypothetical protein
MNESTDDVRIDFSPRAKEDQTIMWRAPATRSAMEDLRENKITVEALAGEPVGRCEMPVGEINGTEGSLTCVQYRVESSMHYVRHRPQRSPSYKA